MSWILFLKCNIQTCTKIKLSSCYITIPSGASNCNRCINIFLGVIGNYPQTWQKYLIYGIFICELVILQKRVWDIRGTTDIVPSDGKVERINHRTNVIQCGNPNNEGKKVTNFKFIAEYLITADDDKGNVLYPIPAPISPKIHILHHFHNTIFPDRTNDHLISFTVSFIPMENVGLSEKKCETKCPHVYTCGWTIG